MEKLENRILVSFKKMDKAAFKLLYEEHYKPVFKYLYFISKNYELSRDLAQDVFYKLWEQRHTIKESKSLLPFLFKIAKNMLTDHYRHKKVEDRYACKDVAIQTDDLLELKVHANFLEEKVREIVQNQMNDKTRTIFLMSRFEGKSNDEISQTLGLSKKTIENHLYAALSILRKKLLPFLTSVLIAVNVLNYVVSILIKKFFV